jgi:predicted nucleic acid-binding protein
MTLPNLVFCDPSFFYACLDPRDTNHARAQALVTESTSISATFCTTWDVISETVTLLRCRRNYRAALAFLADVKPGFASSPMATA